MGSSFFAAIFIFVLFFAASLIIDRILKQISKHYDLSTAEIFRLLKNSQRAILLFIGAVVALSKLGFDVSALVAGLGLTGFALGLALKDAISNLVGGVMIVLYKPFQLGDIIEISGSKGKVTNINLRYFSITADNNISLIPNSLFLSNKLSLFKEETPVDATVSG